MVPVLPASVMPLKLALLPVPPLTTSWRMLFISAAVLAFMATLDWISFSKITLPLLSSTRVKVRGRV